MNRGAFIVFEGLDRCGKTTQINMLLQALANRGVSCVEMTFPDRDTFIGGACSAYLKNEKEMNDEAIHLMFAANRWEKKQVTIQSKLTIRKQIIDTLNQGKTIVCSRYAYSGVAYSATKPGMDFEWCKGPDRGLPEPDTVIYLDVDIEEAAKRSNYGEERYEKRETQQKVKEQFERIISEDHCHVFQRVNANDSIDTVHKNVLARAEKAIEQAAKRAISKLWSI